MRNQAGNRRVSKSNEVKNSCACSSPSVLQHQPLGQGSHCTAGCTKLEEKKLEKNASSQMIWGCNSTNTAAWISHYCCTFSLELVKKNVCWKTAWNTLQKEELESSSTHHLGCVTRKRLTWTSISWPAIQRVLVTAAVSKGRKRYCTCEVKEQLQVIYEKKKKRQKSVSKMLTYPNKQKSILCTMVSQSKCPWILSSEVSFSGKHTQILCKSPNTSKLI